ncbi:MAG: serpin family protein [Actinomycetota bacterium]|nr:serpin family protein [Actinomycetota bacterium]
MRRWAAIAVALSLAGCRTAVGTAPQSIDHMDQVELRDAGRTWVEHANAAGWEHHRTLEGNAVTSPLGLGIAFGAARGAASAEAGRGFERIFGFEDGAADHAAAAEVLAELRALAVEVPDVDIDLGARLTSTVAGHGTLTSPDPYLDLLADAYGAVPAPAFDPGPAAATISWTTAGDGALPLVAPGLRSAAEPDAFTFATTVEVAQPLLPPFDPALTEPGVFTTATGTAVDVALMSQDDAPVPFVDLGDADAVGLSAGVDLTMWLLVPDEDDGLAALESNLEPSTFAELDDVAEPYAVDLAVPRWHTGSDVDVLSWTCPYGLCPGSTLDGVAPGHELTGARLASSFVVDEAGIGAAPPGTGFFLGWLAREVEVRADHPFLWALVHESTGVVVLLGRVTDPS